nr:retrovirus-related Pol polyprotein from transposon TNT 1-94 [Tanacetum cinerariifolium]
NIKMTMSRLQLNSKFVNNMLPEWGRFVTAVKLNRGLRDSNYDQLYAYLKQHETHAKENKMMLERFSQPTVDPLALLSNVFNPQHYLPSSSASSSTQVPPPLADSSSPAEDLIENLTNTLALLTQSYRTFLPQTNNQFRRSSNARNQATLQDGRVGQARPGQARTVKCYNCNGTGHIAQNCTQPKRPQNSEYYKDKMLLMQAQENRVALDAEQLLFLAGGQDNAFDDDVDEQPVQDFALNVDNVFQADDCDAFDSDVDEAPTTQTMYMANLSSTDPVTDEAGPSYDSDILSEYVKDNEVPVIHSDASSVPTDAFMMIYNDICESHDQSVSNPSQNTVVKNSLNVELATYKERVELLDVVVCGNVVKIEYKMADGNAPSGQAPEMAPPRSHRFHPRPDSALHLPNEEPVLGYLKFSAKGTKREVFGMPILGSLITAEIREASYYQEYLAKVAQHRRYLAGETGGVQDPPAPKPTQHARKPKSKPTKAPPRPAATETSDKPPKAKKSKYGWVSKKRSLKHAATSEAEDVPGCC